MKMKAVLFTKDTEEHDTSIARNQDFNKKTEQNTWKMHIH